MLTDVSEVLTASIIALMMEAVCTSETSGKQQDDRGGENTVLSLYYTM
jgi:hypothetical protein